MLLISLCIVVCTKFVVETAVECAFKPHVVGGSISQSGLTIALACILYAEV